MHVPTQSTARRFFRTNPTKEFPPEISTSLESERLVGSKPVSHTMGSNGKKSVLLKTRRGTGRGRGKQNSNQYFTILGNNANGLKAKIRSLKTNIEYFKKPSWITIQETKLRQKNLIKIEGYRIFEKQRIGFGGGVLTAVAEELEPVLISDGEEENEILVVQSKVGKENVRIFNVYAPRGHDQRGR